MIKEEMFTVSDEEKEEKMLADLIESDAALKCQHEDFENEMEFKLQLLRLRREANLTQKDIADRSGLSQQAVSRLERQPGTMLETLLRYLGSMGYSLGVVRNSDR